MPQFLKQDKFRALIKTTCHVRIGTFKFASLFKESPCSRWLHFPASVRMGMAFSPHRGLFFPIFNFTYVFCTIVIFIFSSHVSVEKLLSKESNLLYIYLVMSFLFKLSCFNSYVIGQDLQKNGSLLKSYILCLRNIQ